MADSVKKRRIRRSAFGLTINTNKRILRGDADYEPFAAKFDACLYDICNNIGDYLKFTWGDYSAANFTSVEAEFCIEPAPKTHCVHAHMFLGFSHRTNLRLDYDAILNKVKKDMGLTGVNIKNRILHSKEDEARWKEYLTKYANGVDGEEDNTDA